MDPKASRVFVKGVVAHLQKSLRSYDEKDQDALIVSIEEHIRMIKMASSMKKGFPKKKKVIASKPKKKEDDAPAPMPVAVVAGTASK